MTLNLNSYRHVMGTLTRRLENTQDDQIDDLACSISAATFIPVCAIYYYIAEIRGMTPSIEKSIAGLVKFYGYDKIEGL